MTTDQIAKLICQYNGQKGTEKQIQKVLKSLPSKEMLLRFCAGRIDIKE